MNLYKSRPQIVEVMEVKLENQTELCNWIGYGASIPISQENHEPIFNLIGCYVPMANGKLKLAEVGDFVVRGNGGLVVYDAQSFRIMYQPVL